MKKPVIDFEKLKFFQKIQVENKTMYMVKDSKNNIFHFENYINEDSDDEDNDEDAGNMCNVIMYYTKNNYKHKALLYFKSEEFAEKFIPKWLGIDFLNNKKPIKSNILKRILWKTR